MKTFLPGQFTEALRRVKSLLVVTVDADPAGDNTPIDRHNAIMGPLDQAVAVASLIDGETRTSLILIGMTGTKAADLSPADHDNCQRFLQGLGRLLAGPDPTEPAEPMASPVAMASGTPIGPDSKEAPAPKSGQIGK